MDKSEIPFLSASQLARLIESREVSPVEATEAYLDRINAVDGQPQFLHRRLEGPCQGIGEAGRGRNRGRELPRPAARAAGGSERPVLYRWNGNNGRL